MFYELEIKCTSGNNPKDLAEEPMLFDTREFRANTIEEIVEYLDENYSQVNWRTALKKNKVYIDTKAGEQIHVGFTISYWNSDCSHNSKKWYQQDWIELHKVSYEHGINDLINNKQ